MFNLYCIYSARKSSNHKLSINHKISPYTNLHKTKHTNIRHKTFEELVPSVSPLLKKHIRLGHAGIVDHNNPTTTGRQVEVKMWIGYLIPPSQPRRSHPVEWSIESWYLTLSHPWRSYKAQWSSLEIYYQVNRDGHVRSNDWLTDI